MKETPKPKSKPNKVNGRVPADLNVAPHCPGNLDPVSVDVTGIDRRRLLRALWDNARCCEGYKWSVLSDPSVPDIYDYPEERIIAALRAGGSNFASGKWPHVDYVVGRAIKTRVFAKENVLNATRYDEYWGEGAFARVVASLRV